MSSDHTLDWLEIELGDTYSEPIVDHRIARERALDAYHAFKQDSMLG